MMSVKLNEDNAIYMLVDRLIEYWKPEKEVVELFTKMYENYVYGGCFGDDMEFDPMAIVDNDYVNWCQVIYEGGSDFKKMVVAI